MLNSKLIFQRNIKEANELSAVYDHLSNAISIPGQFEDLLRSQIVYAVSAFDKLMHDLIRIGMVQIFEGVRAQTPKYANEGIPLQHLPSLVPGSIPPPGARFEELVREKLSVLSFQDPSKVSDGLSFIWIEPQKWQVIAHKLGMTDKDAKRDLKLIITRRNAIVHEADIGPVTNIKQAITKNEAANASAFLLALGNCICDLVT